MRPIQPKSTTDSSLGLIFFNRSISLGPTNTSKRLTGPSPTATPLSAMGFCVAFGHCQPQAFGPLPGFILNGREVLVVHPLWDPAAPHGILADALAHCTTPEPLFIDTFNIPRRMSATYQDLATEL